MDINKIQKLNRMSVELKKYNVVGSSKEAISQAEKIYGSENNYLTKNNLPEKDENMDNEIRLLQAAVKRNDERITQIISKMNEMIKEFNELKEAQKALSQRSSQLQAPVQKPAGQPQTTFTTQQQAPAQTAVPPASKPIDRNGIAPSDISIDKYFYCGKK